MCSLCEETRRKVDAVREVADTLDARRESPEAVRLLYEYADLLDERRNEALDASFNDE